MRALTTAVALSLTLIPVRGQDARAVTDPQVTGPARQIWTAPQREIQEVWLRRSFELPAAPKAVELAVSCDNECQVFVNGRPVATCDDHGILVVAEVEALVEGKNVVAVHGKNTGGPAAVVLWLTWVDAKGQRHDLVSDAKWRVAEAEVAGWNEPKFDDSRWAMATESGATPCGRNVYGGEPREIVFVTAFRESAEAIEASVQALRAARTPAAALQALEAIERAVMRARAAAWAQQEAQAKAKK